MGSLIVEPVFIPEHKWILGAHSQRRDIIAAQIQEREPRPPPNDVKNFDGPL